MKKVVVYLTGCMLAIACVRPCLAAWNALFIPREALIATSMLSVSILRVIGLPMIFALNSALIVSAWFMKPRALIRRPIVAVLSVELIALFWCSAFALWRKNLMISVAQDMGTQVMVSGDHTGIIGSALVTLLCGSVVWTVSALSKERQPNQALQTTPITRSEI